jgi:hypothetical protein
MSLFKGKKKPKLNLIDMGQYDRNYSDLFGGMPGEMDDVESFYTPEMQQAQLAAMEEMIREQGAQTQAGISGQAITSGWGVGNTSREAGRRAKADSDMLGSIISSHVQNAQNIEQMRQQQAQDYAARKFDAGEMDKNFKQQRELAELGYTEQLTNYKDQMSEEAKEANRKALAGIINTGGQAIGSMYGGRGGGPSYSGAMSDSSSPLYLGGPQSGNYGNMLRQNTQAAIPRYNNMTGGRMQPDWTSHNMFMP